MQTAVVGKKIWSNLQHQEIGNLALEASSRGLVAHGMQGFDYERARADLQIPDNFDVMAMIAIGKEGPRITFLHKFRKENIRMIENLWKEIVMEGSLDYRKQ